MVESKQVLDFIARLQSLLENEKKAEIEQNSMLLSNYSPRVLEQRGLALCSLGVVNVSVGLGGRSLIELERPSAYHSSTVLPPNTFRPGDLGRIEAHNSVTSNPKSKDKSKKKNANRDTKSESYDSIEGVIYKVSETRIIVAVEQSENSTDDLDLPQRCQLVKLANNITYDRMEKTLNTLHNLILPQNDTLVITNSAQIMHLARVLLGLDPLSTKLRLEELTFFDKTLNESQKEAVRFALESPEVACIHGPPGTGKTHTLVEIIRQMLSNQTDCLFSKPSEQRRILVCGASNLSVDNLLERLAMLPSTSQGPLRCTRLGHPARVIASSDIQDTTLDAQAFKSEQAALVRDIKHELEQKLLRIAGKEKGQKGKAPRGEERRQLWNDVRELRKEYRKRERGVTKSVIDQAQIVLATCHSSGGRQLQNMEFDVVVIDEATQALEPSCWIPILKSKKLILAGDPMQLPPTILSQHFTEVKRDEKKDAPSSARKEASKSKEENANLSDYKAISSPSSSDDSEIEDVTRNKSQSQREVKSSKISLKPLRTLETTLFERLERMYGPSIKCTLKIQYRMHKDICAFPNKTLYRSQLKTDESVAEHLLRFLPNISQNISEDDRQEVLSVPILFFDTQGCDYYERTDGDDQGSKSNENEAMVVSTWIERLIGCGLLPSQIAIITPYQAQVTLLSSMLRSLYGPELEIGTVDGMQGREKEAVVISLVRSNEARQVGFLSEKRRLNVAMTRAKRHLCVVGDSSTVKNGSSYLNKWMNWLENNSDVRFAGLD